MQSEPLHISLFKLSILAVASVLIVLIVLWTGSGAVASYSHALEVHHAAMRDVPLEAGFLGELVAFLRSAWETLLVMLRVAFWVTVGLAGVATILTLLGCVGILTWIGKQVGYGMIKLVEFVKYAWSKDKSEPVAVVDGKKWATKEILADLDKRVTVVERLTAVASKDA